MNSKRIKFNGQKVVALLLAGVILAMTVVSLTWTDVSTSQANRGASLEKASSVEHDSGSPAEFHPIYVASRAAVGVRMGSPSSGGG